MKMDGIELTEGSDIANLSVNTGTAFPASPNAGEMYFRTDSPNDGLYVYNTSWEKVQSGSAGAGTVTSVDLTVPTGLSVSGNPVTTTGTLAISLAAGYSIPTTASQSNWNTAFTNSLRWDGGSTSLVPATGRTSLGATTIGANLFTLANPSTLTYPQFNADNTVSVLTASAFRTAIGAGTSSTVGTVTSVAALTLGTAGTDVSSSVATGTTTPVITLNIPNASATARGALTAADWATFNGKQAALGFTPYNATNPSGYITSAGAPVQSVGVTAPVSNTGTASAPVIAMTAATASVNGYMTSTYASKLDGIAAGATANTGTVTSVAVSGGTTGLTTSGGPITTSGTITLAGTLAVANGGTGATTNAGTAFALKGANADITSLTGSSVWSISSAGNYVSTSATNYLPQVNLAHTGTTQAYFVFDRYRTGITTVANGDSLGNITFRGYDGTTPISSASIASAVAGTVSTGIVPGLLGFYTTNFAGTSAERMRLDSEGKLGINCVPSSTVSAKLHVYSPISGGSAATSGSTDANVTTRLQAGSVSLDIGTLTNGTMWIQNRLFNDFSTNFSLILLPNGGGLSIGTSPSPWASNYKSIDLGTTAAILSDSTSGNLSLTRNTYFDGTNHVAKTTATSAIYNLTTTGHRWFNAPSVTAGTAATYVQHMHLDGNGNLAVGAGLSPSPWASTITSLDFNHGAVYSNTGNATGITDNAYSDGTWRAKNTTAASRFIMQNGVFSWYSAPATTAGAALTETQMMILDTSGNLSVAGKVISPNVREKLTAARTYYVGYSGANDSNNGLTTGTSFATIQTAINTASSLDLSSYNVTIQLNNGTYSTTQTLVPYVTGGGVISIVGNTTTPSSVLINPAGMGFVANAPAGYWAIGGMKLNCTGGSGYGILANSPGVVFNLSYMDFGACGVYQVLAQSGAYIGFTSGYTISGGAAVHIAATANSNITCAGITVTLTGTPAFTYFARSTTGSNINLNTNTYSGAATGSRYFVDINASIFVNGAGTTYLPGNTAGTLATGGQYS